LALVLDPLARDLVEAVRAEEVPFAIVNGVEMVPEAASSKLRGETAPSWEMRN
jgi:hypothetical protein